MEGKRDMDCHCTCPSKPQGGQVVKGPLDGNVPVRALFQRAIEPFHHPAFDAAMRGKIPSSFMAQHARKRGIVEFFALVHLQPGRTTSPSASSVAFQNLRRFIRLAL